ncbi:MAG: hypothetical protein WCO60_01060 [Verrucomicrobiota bacterium]
MKSLSLSALLLSLFCKGTPAPETPAKTTPAPTPDKSAWLEIEAWVDSDSNPPQIARTQTRRLREAHAASHLCWILDPEQSNTSTHRSRTNRESVG